MSDSVWHLEYAWLGPTHRGVLQDVTLDVRGGRIQALNPDTPVPAGATRLPGLSLPGFANAHSHAFHRALRGRTTGTSFRSWRAEMYALAARLDPDTYYALARATYAELVLAGFTSVGEFHYLHHNLDGSPYADPNAMGDALVRAAADAGIRITLLDTCYLAGGLDDGGQPVALDETQQRFADTSVEQWARRVDQFRPEGEHARVGAAIHSVRAVPAAAIEQVAGWSEVRDAPLHVHVSEQPAENAASIAAYGRTPTELLADLGALTHRTTLVHATHVDAGDLSRIGDARPFVCLCPTTEADLADGIGPAPELSEAAVLCLGSDSHACVDPFTEARAVELHERLASGRRQNFDADELLGFATAGHDALGWRNAGALEVGARADLVTVDLDNVRLAGADLDRLLDAVVFGASAADVRHVLVDGRTVVDAGVHRLIDDVAGALRDAVGKVAGS